MTTITTTTQHKGRRRVAAVLLVGLGITSLGVASASHLDVTAGVDPVASGAAPTSKGQPSLIIDKASVAVTYGSLMKDPIGYTRVIAEMNTAETMAPTVTLTLSDSNKIPKGTKVHVYFYDNKKLVAWADPFTTPKPTKTNTTPQPPEPTKTDTTPKPPTSNSYNQVLAGDHLLVDEALPYYDRIAVVAESPNYQAGK